MESKGPATHPNVVRPALLVPLAAILYLTEGFPFGLVNELFPLYLRQQKFSPAEIGVLVSTVGLAWTLKSLWAPLVDRWGSYRSWITGALAVITLSLATFVFSTPPPLLLVWIALAAIAFASATQDIAIDGASIRMTPTDRLGRVNGTRIAAYRCGFILSGGAMAAVASAMHWPGAFGVAIAICAALLTAMLFLPLGESGGSHPDLGSALRAWFKTPDLLLMLVIVVLYKLADAALYPMIKVFWVDAGYSAGEIGWVTTVIGVAFTVIGGIVGGIIIERLSIFRSLLYLGVLQAASNAVYAIVAMSGATRTGLYAATITENFCGGLGTAAFMTFLMAMCSRERAATEFAFYSALFGFSRSLVGSGSGFGVEAFGYTNFFWLTAVLGLPGLFAVLAMRRRLLRLEVRDT